MDCAYHMTTSGESDASHLFNLMEEDKAFLFSFWANLFRKLKYHFFCLVTFIVNIYYAILFCQHIYYAIHLIILGNISTKNILIPSMLRSWLIGLTFLVCWLKGAITLEPMMEP